MSTVARSEAEVLLGLTARANDALTMDAIYQPALEAVCKLLSVERASILLFDDDGVMRFKAWLGLSERYRRTLEGHSPWTRDTKDPQPFCTADVECDPALGAYVPLFRSERIRSLVFIPLVCRGELLGKFMAYAEGPRTFSERELQLGAAVAVQVAQACARGRLIDAERHARERAERSADLSRRLLRVTSHLSNAMFDTDIAGLVVDEGAFSLGARSAGMWLLEGRELRLLRDCGYGNVMRERVSKLSLDDEVPVTRTARTGESIWLENEVQYAHEFPRFSEWAQSQPGYRPQVAVACLPIMMHGRVLGALGFSFDGRRAFDEPERTFLTLLAQHCGQALERARLYQEAQAATRRARFLAQASALLGESLDCATALRSLADLILPQIADWCSIELADAAGNITPVCVNHVDPAKLALVRSLRAAHPARVDDPCGGVPSVTRTGRPELYARITDELLEASTHGDTELLNVARGLGLTSAMIVPMRAHGKTFGAIMFVTAESKRVYTEADVEMAVQLGERAGLAVHNANLYEQAIAAVQQRDDFLSVAGHELRTPVAALLLQAQSLARADKVPDPARIRDRAERLTRYAKRLTALVDDLLDVTRISSGRLQLSRELVDLRDVVREVLEGASEQVARSRAEVRLSADEPVCGRWDRHRLEQVAMNLLSNALKYGGDQPIDVIVQRANDCAVLRLRDRGIGISVEHQQRIFERFERAVSSHNFGGLGLGLWISRQIVDAHGGSVKVVSEVGQGAEFIVTLPLAQSA